LSSIIAKSPPASSGVFLFSFSGAPVRGEGDVVCMLMGRSRFMVLRPFFSNSVYIVQYIYFLFWNNNSTEYFIKQVITFIIKPNVRSVKANVSTGFANVLLPEKGIKKKPPKPLCFCGVSLYL
jgi:hypothetical protein